MIKDVRFEEIGREHLYNEYLRRCYEGLDAKKQGLTEQTLRDMEKAKEIFEGKTECEVFIKGDVLKGKDYLMMFTFLEKTYPLKDNAECITDILLDLDNFKKFMDGGTVNYYSEVEHEYINFSRVMNASVFIELR